jgi:aldehyde:ferredoxin oxidoreductase
MVCYDYEPIFSLGSMLGGTDPEGLLKLLDGIEGWGMDAMSTGVVLAWATEAQERGLISEAETLGVRLNWGDYPAYLQAARQIVEQPNDFYRALAQGVDHASSIYGGGEFALAVGKNEMPGYHTGPAAYLGYLMGARHSHLDNAGYSVDQKVLSRQALSPDALVDTLLAEEEWRQVLSSLVICFFARGIYDTGTVLKALNAAGYDLAEDDLAELGRATLRAKYAFKVREGFTFEGARLPQRIFETESPLGLVDEAYVRDAVAAMQRRLVVPALS